jgi:hypothetical protein
VLLGQVLDGSSAACAFGCEAYDQNNPEDIANRTGGQQLAEVVIYNRKLTRQESLDVQAYLYWKWFGTALSGYAEPGQPFALGAVNVDAGKSGELKLFGDTKVDLGEVSGNLALTSESPVSANVAAGSELNLDGVVLSGSTVSGDSSARALDFTDGGIGELSVENLRLHEGAIVSIEVAGPDQDQVVASGTLTLDGGGTIKMHFDERDDYTGMYQIITFGSMDSTSQDNLADWQVTGNVPSKYKTVLTVEDDALTVSISERGLLLFLR